MRPLLYINFFFKQGVADIELASIDPFGLARTAHKTGCYKFMPNPSICSIITSSVHRCDIEQQ